ncbi:MAG TPA: glucosyl-3-phosphoglycerate synthase [Actinobacteria bacterium]|nr:glucosyl-3-phosphoglycerate synthase [Actinomycetota bacterium]
MDIDDWYDNNTFHYKQFSVKKLVRIKKKKNVGISLCFPTLNEEQTIGKILSIVNKTIYEPGLVDEVIVIDSNSSDNTADIVESAGFEVYQHKDILHKYGSYEGKGDALWKSLSVLKGEIILWCDSDIVNFRPGFIYGLLGPLLLDERISYVKAFYRRPLKIDSSYMKSEGGRVTEILVRPIINLFYPKLSKIFQPLSGEYAGRRRVLEKIPFSTGYGVEIGMLIEIYERFGLETIAQVNVKRRVHRNKPLAELSKMSFGIMQAITRKLEYYKKIKVCIDLNKIYNQIEYLDKEFMIKPLKLEENERPPMSEIEEYNRNKKNIARRAGKDEVQII